MTCSWCGRPVNTPRTWTCPEYHYPPAPTPTQPAVPRIERYVRAAITFHGGSVHAGLAYERGESISILCDVIRSLLRDAMSEGNPANEDNVEAYTAAVERAFAAAWPGRPFFVETFQDTGRDEEPLTQVYQPYGRSAA